MDDIQVVLASSSPRRHEILDLAGIPHTIIPSLDESAPADLPPEERVLALAKSKAQEVASRCSDRLVLGADTMVVLGDKNLGKPRTPEQAVEMLLSLQGKEHKVMTGVWLVLTDDCGKAVKENGFTDVATVKFLPFDRAQAQEYVATGEPMDKAGAYGIQGYGMRFVDCIHGDFYTIMGLPSGKLIRFIQTFLED